MPAWTIQLRSADPEPIGVLWRVPGIEALSHADHIWLRSSSVDDATTRLLQCLPCVARYEILADGALRLTGHRVPQGYLPEGQWRPLDQFLTVTLPVGVPAVDVTVKSTVTAWPTADGSGVWLVIVVVVAAAPTVWATPADVLPAKLPSPA